MSETGVPKDTIPDLTMKDCVSGATGLRCLTHGCYLINCANAIRAQLVIVKTRIQEQFVNGAPYRTDYDGGPLATRIFDRRDELVARFDSPADAELFVEIVNDACAASPP